MRRGKRYSKRTYDARPHQAPRTDKLGRSTNERHKTVFEFILSFTVEHMGHTPTLRQICAACMLSSTSVAAYHVARLVKEDKLRYLDDLLVIPGSQFTWHEELGEGVPLQEGFVSATQWPVLDADAKREGDRPLLPMR